MYVCTAMYMYYCSNTVTVAMGVAQHFSCIPYTLATAYKAPAVVAAPLT